MNTQTKKTIVAFHIGKGGHFHNPGYLSFIGENKIGNYTDDLFLNYENTAKIFNKIKGRENLENKWEKAIEGNKDAIAFFENRLKMPFGELVYTDASGNEVGLTDTDVETGIGIIELDGDYNTTYTCYLEDCGEKELRAILKSNEWDQYLLQDFFNIADLNIDWKKFNDNYESLINEHFNSPYGVDIKEYYTEIEVN